MKSYVETDEINQPYMKIDEINQQPYIKSNMWKHRWNQATIFKVKYMETMESINHIYGNTDESANHI